MMIFGFVYTWLVYDQCSSNRLQHFLYDFFVSIHNCFFYFFFHYCVFEFRFHFECLFLLLIAYFCIFVALFLLSTKCSFTGCAKNKGIKLQLLYCLCSTRHFSWINVICISLKKKLLWGFPNVVYHIKKFSQFPIC